MRIGVLKFWFQGDPWFTLSTAGSIGLLLRIRLMSVEEDQLGENDYFIRRRSSAAVL